MTQALAHLQTQFSGTLFYDEKHRIAFATDASPYRIKPLLVAYPACENDLILLVHFAREHQLSITPRTAGTSLAGQAIGEGIVVDFSVHFNAILELNTEEKWVKVQPGVILDELNQYLSAYHLFFGPETSTSNRCMIGGMVGNNACGAHSLIYGSTRDHLLAVKVILSDGSIAQFESVDTQSFHAKCSGNTLENKIYDQTRRLLNNIEHQKHILEDFPDSSVARRNTGYALDLLLQSEPFGYDSSTFNFCKLLAGSEGTLAVFTELTLQLVPSPPTNKAVIAAHFHSLEQSIAANLIALTFKPDAIELIDKTILDLTKENLEQQKNRFFIQGDPSAILIIEFARNQLDEIESLTSELSRTLQMNNLGYHFPVITGKDIQKIWSLRKAGLGVLSNMPGDAKPVSIIEDTAVPVEKLADYIQDVKELLTKYNLTCVYHAHIGSGELHLRPILNLKLQNDIAIFQSLAVDVAHLVKKYRGSMSGEHGDGRLRGTLIPIVLGENNYSLMRQVKSIWDPNHIFNRGVIIDSPPIEASLRYRSDTPVVSPQTFIDFSNEQGILRFAERCNGSADCRKTEQTGGIMCPSYMATRNELYTTRSRANLLREFLTTSTKKNRFNHQELYDLMDLCISCKGCKSECPSNVDMSLMKAEFLHQYFSVHGIPIRNRVIASFSDFGKLGMLWPYWSNFLINNRFVKQTMGFSLDRKLPSLPRQTVRQWIRHHGQTIQQQYPSKNGRKVYLFIDEFTNYHDVSLGQAAFRLLTQMGYEVLIPPIHDSARAAISKGLLKKASRIATKNILLLKNILSEDTPLVGIEPSAILGFRDEYPRLVDSTLKTGAHELSSFCLLSEEFIVREAKAGRITSEMFTNEAATVRLHCHCHQKVLAGSQNSLLALQLPANYSIHEIPSSCCGMAGSFGYEAEHAALSKKIGELVLMKEVRKTPGEVVLAAQGTSCRNQIRDCTGRTAWHPLEILFRALKES